MEYLKYVFLTVLVFTELTVLVFALKSQKPFKTIIMNAFFGITTVLIINLTAAFTGAYIPLNYYTVIGSGIFGLPAVCSFLLFNLIFI